MNILPREAITVKQAAEIASVTDETVYNWISKYGIGQRSYGDWAYVVSLPALLAVMQRRQGGYSVLDALHAGDRQNPVVAECLERAETIRLARLAA